MSFVRIRLTICSDNLGNLGSQGQPGRAGRCLRRKPGGFFKQSAYENRAVRAIIL
jgi:hypothetical protein